MVNVFALVIMDFCRHRAPCEQTEYLPVKDMRQFERITRKKLLYE